MHPTARLPATSVYGMMSRKRKGMIVKNTDDRPVEVNLATRTLLILPGEEYAISADEVKDPVLRENLQVRAISIVRPTTDAEEDAVLDMLAEIAARAAAEEDEEQAENAEQAEENNPG